MREAVRKTVPAQIKTHFSFRSCAKRETVLGLQREKGANASISVRVGPCTRGYPGFLLSNTDRMASRIVFRGKARCRSRRCLLSDLLPRQRQAKRLRAELVLPVYSTIVPRFVPCPTIAMTSPVTVHRFIAFSALFFWFHLAAFAFYGPASRRPAKSAAAEIPCRLLLPPAAAARNPGRGPSSFRQDEKKMGGALRRSWFANRPRRRVQPLRLALLGTSPCRGGWGRRIDSQ